MIHKFKVKRHGRALLAEAGKNLLSWATPGNAEDEDKSGPESIKRGRQMGYCAGIHLRASAIPRARRLRLSSGGA